MDRRVILTFTTFIFLLLASIAAIAYNKGYRPSFKKTGPVVEATGLLVATSSPDGAQVFLNNRLVTATNDTLSLPEGDYQVKIIKDGYIPWEKELKIKTGVVTETQARLFPTAPNLRAETSSGVFLPTLSLDGTKLVYDVASGSAEKRGVWVMDLTDRPLLTQAQARQIAQNLPRATFTWSPDSKQIMATTEEIIFLLEADRLNPFPQEITSILNSLLDSWEKDIKAKENNRLSNLKSNLVEELGKMQVIAFSPDETKILYRANQAFTLPPLLEKIPPGSSTQPEQRELKEGVIYVYDLKEDKNFFITDQVIDLVKKEGKAKDKKGAGEASSSAIAQLEAITQAQRSQPLKWFPDSRHLIWVEDETISVLEYDGTNKATIYTGPFENSFVYPWPNSSKLIILTTYNRPAGIEPNLYSISLK